MEVVAHSFDELDRLRDCVAGEWSEFRPQSLRLTTRPHGLSGPGIVLDRSVYVARYRDMRGATASMRIVPFEDAEAAVSMVAARYRHMLAEYPALARNVPPSAPDDVRTWHRSGELWAMQVSDTDVGLLAAAPSRMRWIVGDVINEEVVAAEHNGRGYAAFAQRAWAETVAGDGRRLLIGAIDRLNTASHRTAGALGRRRVLDMVFMPLRQRAARSTTSDGYRLATG